MRAFVPPYPLHFSSSASHFGGGGSSAFFAGGGGGGASGGGAGFDPQPNNTPTSAITAGSRRAMSGASVAESRARSQVQRRDRCVGSPIRRFPALGHFGADPPGGP